MPVTLRPVTAADLPLIDSWFEDPETRRWLGGPGWARHSLTLTGPRRYLLVGEIDGTPFGLSDVELDPDNRASFAIAIDPTRRKQGLAAEMTEAIVEWLTAQSVRQLYAGVESGNIASRRLLEYCGFDLTGPVDAEGFVYYARDL